MHLTKNRAQEQAALLDCSCLTTLPFIESLEVDSCFILTSADKLKKFTKLRRLVLKNCQFESYQFFAFLTPLESLELTFSMDNRRLSDTSVLSPLTNLQSLALFSSQIEDFSSCSGLTNLTSLSLNHSPMNSALPLIDLVNLTSLDLSGTKLASLAGLEELTCLCNLRLNKVRTPMMLGYDDVYPETWYEPQYLPLDPLQKLPLTALQLRGTRASALETLLKLPLLKLSLPEISYPYQEQVIEELRQQNPNLEIS